MSPLIRHEERFRLLRRLARELRYRPLDGLVGLEITLTSAGGAANEARKWLANEKLHAGKCRHGDGSSAMGTLAKYDLVDLTFEAPSHALAHDETRSGVPLLRELALLTSHAPAVVEPSDGPAFEEDLACLETLVADLDDDDCVARVFVESVAIDDRDDPVRLPFRLRGELPPRYFPRRFRVTDACVTNVPGAWLAKHFYL